MKLSLIAILSMFLLFGEDCSAKRLIVTSIFPLYDFTREIVRERSEVILLLEKGIDPHHFEPKPKDLAILRRADFFVYGGGVIDPYVKRMTRSLKGSKLKMIDASRGLELKEISGKRDPHVWLDLDLSQKMVDNIKEALCEKDAENCEFYRKNAEEYKDRLKALEKKFRDELSSCRVKTIIHIGHGSFGYLSEKYGFDYFSLYPVHKESEPKPKDLLRLKEEVRKSSAKYIFYERTSNQKLVDSIVRELKIEKVPLDPLESIPKERQSITFIEGMEENLSNLKRGLECGK